MLRLIPRSIPMATLAAALLAAPLAAQSAGAVRRAPTDTTNVRIYINGQELAVPQNLQEMLFTRRARLGVTVDLKAQPNDSVGATLSAVTPGGPAFKVGIQSGDIIVKLNGTSVTSGPRPADAEDDQSLPGLRLVEIASRLAPDITVSVEYKRGNQRRTVSLVTGNEAIALGDLLEGERRMVFLGPDGDRRIVLQPTPGSEMPFRFNESPVAGRLFGTWSMGRFADLELTPLNPDLGNYFGTSEGVLVVRVGERSTLGLKGGDVLLSIDGRQVASPDAALRILRSYEVGDTLRLEILRNRQKQTLTATISPRE